MADKTLTPQAQLLKIIWKESACSYKQSVHVQSQHAKSRFEEINIDAM